MNIVIIIIITSVISFFLIKKYKKGGEKKVEKIEEIEQTQSQPEPDEWLQLRDALPARLMKAIATDINKVAMETETTPEEVKQVAHPKLWLEFGEFIKKDNSLEEAVTFGGKILNIAGSQSLLFNYFREFMNSPSGWGKELKPSSYVWRLDGSILKYIFNIGDNIKKNLSSISSIGEYVSFIWYIPESYWKNGEKDEFIKKKEELLEKGRSNCESLEDYIKWYKSVPVTCEKTGNDGMVLCTCVHRHGVAWRVASLIREALKNATSIPEVEKIIIPPNLHESDSGYDQLSNDLEEEKQKRIKILEKEEKEKKKKQILSYYN